MTEEEIKGLIRNIFKEMVGTEPTEEDVEKIYLRSRVRGFEAVNNAPADTVLPERKTEGSAGYDFRMPEEVILFPGNTAKVKTNIKAYMLKDEYLQLHIRSSLGKKGLRLTSTVGIIDSDYYGNPDNDGNIICILKNDGEEVITLLKGEAVAQGIFSKYLLADNDNVKAKRVGGFGSTGK